MTLQFFKRYKLIAFFFCALMLFTSCTYYRLANRGIRPALTQKLVNKKDNVAVIIHDGDLTYQLENPSVDSGLLSGTLKEVDEPIEFFYNRLRTVRTLKVKKMDRKYIHQVHFFVNPIPVQDSTNFRINTSEIESTKEIKLNLKTTFIANIIPEFLWLTSVLALILVCVG
jgi:glycerophosphoryl diester phosphodiesterase